MPEYKLELNQNQQLALEQALRKMKTGEGILKNNEKINKFAQERKDIDSFAEKKHPVVKEYIKLHKVAETKSYTNIGRMVRDMKQIAAEQEALKIAAEMCTDANDKEGLMQAAKDLDNHPAMLAYEKYIRGLKYLSGMEENLDKDVKEFFEEDMRVVIGQNKDYIELRDKEVKPATTDVEKANQEFQKLTAEAKAIEIYSKSGILSHAGICKQFLGVREVIGTIGLFRDRMTPALFCVAQMIKQGYSIEEVTNPRLFIDEKKKIGEEYMRRRKSNTREDEKWYLEEMYNGAEAMIKAYKQYLKEHKDEIKTEQDLALRSSELGVFAHLCYDMLQELDAIKNSVHREFKTPEEFYAMAFKAGSYTFGEGTGTTDHIIFDIQEDNEMSMFVTEIQRQLYIKTFLEELKKDEPDIEVLRGTPETFNMMRDQIESMPEVKAIFTNLDPEKPGGDWGLDVENLSSKQVKVLASMMTLKFLDDNNITVITPKIPVKVTKDPLEGNGVFIKEGKEINKVVLHKGKQVIETDLPGKTSDYLHDLEKKGIRGKAKDNSDEFNNLIRHYAETMQKLESTNSLNKDCIDELNKLKAAAAAYINAKRAQKGYESKTVPDATIDNMMLGKEKGGASIFTSRGKDRYQFALDLIERAKLLENKFNELEMQNLGKENENKEVKQSDTTVVKEEKDTEIAPKGAEIPTADAQTKTNEAAEIKEETPQPTPEVTAGETTQPTPQPAEQTTPQPTPQPEKPKKPTQKELYIEKMNNYLSQDESEMEPHQKAARANLVEWASISLGSKANLFGDPEKIQSYMDKHPNLNVLQKEHLQERKAANEKIQNYNKSRSLDQKKRPPCLVDGNKIMLNKAKSVPKQTSASGCWSCVLSDMLAHFGVDLTQKEIRYYRPKFIQESLKRETFKNSEAFRIMSRLCFDTQNEIYDVADLIHTTVPNVALHHMQVDPQTPGIGEKFLNKVKDILINHNSPIAVCMKGHYRAIVGVEGDRLIIEDSAKTAGRYTTGVDSFLAECTDKGDRIIVDWLQDITFTKDGKCSIVTEQTKLNNLDCKDGVFSDSAFEYDSHVSGNEYFLDADGMGETVYLPKMAFEKEMNIPYEVVEEHNIAVDEAQNEMQNEVQENSVEEQEQVNEEPKYSKREILNDTDLLINDPQMFEFAKAVVRLMNELKDAEIAGLTYYDDWSNEMKAKIPMDMLVNDLELGYSEEELRLMNTEELRDVLKDVVDLQTFFYAEETIQERQSEMENEQDDMCL